MSRNRLDVGRYGITDVTDVRRNPSYDETPDGYERGTTTNLGWWRY